MKIYIAGKITGLPEAEYKAKFAQAAAHLIAQGHTPLNPLEICRHLPANSPWEKYMGVCIYYLIHYADAIWLLPCWEDSQGAKLEAEISRFYSKGRYLAPLTPSLKPTPSIMESSGILFFSVIAGVYTPANKSCTVLVRYEGFDHDASDDSPHVVVIEAFEEVVTKTDLEGEEVDYTNHSEVVRCESLETALFVVKRFNANDAADWVAKNFVEVL